MDRKEKVATVRGKKGKEEKGKIVNEQTDAASKREKVEK